LLFCWLATVFAKLSKTWLYSVAVLSIRGERTIIRKTEDARNVNILSLSTWRVICILQFVSLPRVVVAAGLGVLGVEYLALARTLQDILLNCLSLIFILSVDTMLYESFAPRQIDFLLSSIVLPVTISRHPLKYCSTRWSWLAVMLTLVGLLVSVNISIINPMLQMMEQGMRVICSGEVDFIYTESPLTGMVIATKTFDFDSGISWTSSELAVVQLASPSLDAEYFDGEVLAASTSSQTLAVLLPGSLATLENGMPSMSELDLIASVDTSNVATLAESVACEDQASSDYNNSNILRNAVALGNLFQTMPAYCEAALDYCWMMNMTGVRALCPFTCGCSTATLGHAGFFQNAKWGCPTACAMSKTLLLEFENNCSDQLTSSFVADSIWARYIDGMKAYVLSAEVFSDRLLADLSRNYALLGIKQEQILDVHRFFVGDGFWNAITLYNFSISDTAKHPRNLTGCDFIVSYEIQYILNLNLCDGEAFTSLRAICPVACDCSAGSKAGCPSGCSSS